MTVPTQQEMEAAYGSTPSDPNWNPDCDLNDDGRVDGLDMWLFYNPTEAEQLENEIEEWHVQCSGVMNYWNQMVSFTPDAWPFDYNSDGWINEYERNYALANLGTDRAKVASFLAAYGQPATGAARLYDFDGDGVIGGPDLRQFYDKVLGVTVPDYPWSIPERPTDGGCTYHFNADTFAKDGFNFSSVWDVEEQEISVVPIAEIEASQAALAADDSILLSGQPPTLPSPTPAPPNPFGPLMPGDAVPRWHGNGWTWVSPSYPTPGWVGPPGWRNPNAIWPPGYPHPSIPGVWGPGPGNPGGLPPIMPPSWQGPNMPLLPGDYYWEPAPPGWPGGGVEKPGWGRWMPNIKPAPQLPPPPQAPSSAIAALRLLVGGVLQGMDGHDNPCADLRNKIRNYLGMLVAYGDKMNEWANSIQPRLRSALLPSTCRTLMEALMKDLTEALDAVGDAAAAMNGVDVTSCTALLPAFDTFKSKYDVAAGKFNAVKSAYSALEQSAGCW